jgi:hypothetical protein
LDFKRATNDIVRSQTAVEFNSEAMIMLVIISGSLFLAQSNITAAVSQSSMPSAITYALIAGSEYFYFTKVSAFV